MEFLTTPSHDNMSLFMDSNKTVSNKDERQTSTFVISWDDATWVLTSSFIIFTMQSGFGLLEAGAVSTKNEVNIMVKNAIDVVFGGITYWAFGYGLSFGMDSGTNPFCGVGYWFVESTNAETMGAVYSTFIFQLSFATTATTIVSGAMAERTHLRSYIVFSLLNTVIYCIPAHWIWAENGFLAKLGVIDIAGSGCVHLVGGSSALVAAALLGPRQGRYDNGSTPSPLGNGTNTLIGMFMLWWGWLAFNSGSTFGISGGKWILAARTAVTTLNASMGGGIVGIFFTMITNKGKILVPDIATSILGALVAITASCALVRPWEAVLIGAIGAFLCLLGVIAMDKVQIDDPVAAVAVHGVGGLWGMIAVGFFVDLDKLEDFSGGQRGLNWGGGFYLLGIQVLACVCIVAWSVTVTWFLLAVIKLTMGLRLSPEEELLGSDLVEHDIKRPSLEGFAMNHGFFGFQNQTEHSTLSTLVQQLHNLNNDNLNKRRFSSSANSELPNGKHTHTGNGLSPNTRLNGQNGHTNSIPVNDILYTEHL